jgi:hypothetical protein
VRHRVSGKHKPHSRKNLLGQPHSEFRLKVMSIARRYARSDRRGNPLYCNVFGKLMYDSKEIALSTGAAITRASGNIQYVHPCPRASHWHLTREKYGPTGRENDQAR